MRGGRAGVVSILNELPKLRNLTLPELVDYAIVSIAGRFGEPSQWDQSQAKKHVLPHQVLLRPTESTRAAFQEVAYEFRGHAGEALEELRARWIWEAT